MYIKWCFLCAFVMLSAIYGKPVTFLNYLVDVTNKKCPSYESLAKQSQFLNNCVYSNTSDVRGIGWEEEKIALCAMYYNVFQYFCLNTNSKFYEKRDLIKEFEQIPNEFSNNAINVCMSLKHVNSSLLMPHLISVFNNTQHCVHACTDWEDKVLNVCSLTSFIWNLTDSYYIAKQLSDTVNTEATAQLQGSNILNKTLNDTLSDVKEKSNTTMVSSSKIVEQFQPKHNNTKHEKVSEMLPTTIAASKIDISPQQGSVQTGETKSEEESRQRLTEVTPSVTNKKPSVTDTKVQKVDATNKAERDKEQSQTDANIVTNAAKQSTQKIATTNIIDNLSKNNNLERMGNDEQSIKNPIIDPQLEERKGEKKEDNQDDIKVEDYSEDDDEGIENNNEPPPPQKETKEDAAKPKDDGYELPPPKSSEVKTKFEAVKPKETDEDGLTIAANYQNQNIDDSDSYFFSYFMMVCVVFICGYVAYHNKQKILALVLEGRKGRRLSRTRRPNSSNYRKLDSTLEEAVTSSCSKNTTQVIY